jgi:hypothetical protein
MLRHQVEGAAVGLGQQFLLAAVAALPDGADGVNDVLGGKVVALGDARAAGRTIAKLATFPDEVRTGLA